MQRSLMFALLLASVLLVCVFVYTPGFGAIPGYDDEPNLRELAGVFDWRSANAFVFSGMGPVGRPLALASFLPYAGDWRSIYADLLRDNLLIHLLNICLVVWCALRLVRLVESSFSEQRAAMLAVAAGGLWGLSPMLVSASLSAIQRMTSLSALFMLLGFLLYLVGRARLAKSGGHAGLMTMSLGVVGGTGLAVLCKENGALLPALLLVVECTLFRRHHSDGHWFRVWRAVFLTAPMVAVVLYLLSTLPSAGEAYAHREFTLMQRVLAQPVILLEYLLNTFFPRRIALSPFHDDYVAPSMAVSGFAILAWLGVVYLVWRLRHISVWPAFAVGWYLVAHAIESTVIPLELYFEHRNYVPLVGVWIALAALLGHVSDARRRLALTVAVLYLALCASVAHSYASVWGAPAFAARLWGAEAPTSERAQQFLSQQMLREGDHVGAWAVLDEAATLPGGSTTLLLQSIHVGCDVDEYWHRRERFDLLLERAPSASLSFAFHDGVRKLSAAVSEDSCDGVDHDDVLSLLEQLSQNPKYVANGVLRKFLLQAEAQVLIDSGRVEDAFRVVREIYDIQPDTDTAIDIALQYLIRGDDDAARGYLARERARLGNGGVRNDQALLKLDAVSSLVREGEPIVE